jgi:hypothetical protein
MLDGSSMQSTGCRLPGALPAAGGSGKRQSSGNVFFFFFYFFIFFLFFLFYLFVNQWHFGGKGNHNGRLEYSFKSDGIIEVCRYYILPGKFYWKAFSRGK